MRQRGVTGAEVVECDHHSKRPQFLKHPGYFGAKLADQHGLGHLNVNLRKALLVRFGMELQSFGQATLPEVTGRDIDRDAAWINPCLPPAGNIGAHAGEHAIGKLDRNVGIRKSGGDLGRWKDMKVLATDPQKCFPAHDTACAEIDLRLIEWNYPVLFQRLPRCCEHPGSSVRRVLQGWGELEDRSGKF